jgi:hypothetical protein
MTTQRTQPRPVHGIARNIRTFTVSRWIAIACLVAGPAGLICGWLM